MKKLRITLLACAALLIVSILLIRGFNGQAAHAASSSNACGSWSIVHTPIPPLLKHGSNFHGTVSLSSNDVWAVGFGSPSTPPTGTLTEHWNGSQWSIVTSPNVGSSESDLIGVTSVASNNVWAVGSYMASSDTYQTLIEQWNGTSWSVVPSPNVGTYSNTLEGITAVSANTVWAVGSYNTNAHNHSQALIEQWNGSSWSVVPSPIPVHNDSNYLSAITTIPGTSQVRAVGIRVLPSNDMDQTLTEYYC